MKKDILVRHSTKETLKAILVLEDTISNLGKYLFQNSKPEIDWVKNAYVIILASLKRIQRLLQTEKDLSKPSGITSIVGLLLSALRSCSEIGKDLKKLPDMCETSVALQIHILQIYKLAHAALSKSEKLKSEASVFELEMEDTSLGLALHYMLSDVETAASYLKLCSDYLKKQKSNSNLAHRFSSYYLAMAKLYTLQKMYKKARRSLAIAESYEQQDLSPIPNLHLANTYLNLACSNKMCGRYQQAIQYWENANMLLRERVRVFSKPTVEIEKYLLSHLPKGALFNYKLAINDDEKSIQVNTKLIELVKGMLFEKNLKEIVHDIEASEHMISVTKFSQFEVLLSTDIKDLRLIFDNLKIDYTLTSENGLIIDICLIQPKLLRKVWNNLTLALKKIEEIPQRETEETTTINLKQEMYPCLSKELIEDKSETLSIGTTLYNSVKEKEEKLQRHQIKEKKREESAKQKEMNIVSCTVDKIIPTDSKKIIKWHNSHFSEANLKDKKTPYMRIHGLLGKKTYSIITPEALAAMPTYIVEKKFLRVAKDGKAYGSENSKNKEGYIFYKDDNKLRKYGDDYNCKMKIFGKKGAGKMRLIGHKVTTGTLIKNGNNQEVDLYEFNKLILKAHK